MLRQVDLGMVSHTSDRSSVCHLGLLRGGTHLCILILHASRHGLSTPRPEDTEEASVSRYDPASRTQAR